MKSRKMRFVGMLTALLLFGFITTCLVSYYVAHDSLSSQIAETTLPLTSDNIYSEIQRDLLRPIFISSLMAQDTFLRDWVISGEREEEPIVRYLEEIQKRYGTVTSFFVSEKTRKYYHPSGVLKRVSEADPQDKWYFRVRGLHNDYEINVDADTADRGSLTIFINYRVFDYRGRYIGVTGVGLAVSAVRDMVDTYQQRYGRRVYFVDRQGNITLRSAHFKGPENLRQVKGLASQATQLLTCPSSSFTYKEDGKTVYLNSRLVSEFGWYLLVEQEDDPSEARILSTLLGNLAVSLVVTAVVLFLVNLTIGRYQQRLEEMATTDKLTGAANRQAFDMLFEQAVRLAKRRGGVLAAIMLDLDRFKIINDTHGHPAGDLVLKAMAGTVRSLIREADMFFRWGGEEFLILLPDCDLAQAGQVAEKLRLALEAQKDISYGGQGIAITASFGVAQFQDGEGAVELIRRVDSALYAAKDKGRNRVEMAG
ncbi:MAG: sensor domain-containing diguanylate cyclase [Thermodesulfobacteriota bacterium]